MTMRLKHVGYGLLLATAFFNVWFYSGTLFPSLYSPGADDGSGYNAVLMTYPAQSGALIEYSGGNKSWDASTTGADDAFEIEASAHFSFTAVILAQIYWLQKFATVMFDVLAVAFAFALIFHPDRNGK